MNQFLDELADMQRNCFQEKLENISKRGKSVIIVGANPYGMYQTKNLEARGIHVTSFSDFNPELFGKKIENYEIISPEKIEDDQVVIICTPWDVDSKTACYFYEKKIEYVDLTVSNSRYANHFGKDYILRNIDRCFRAYDLLEDEVSKRAYLALIRYRMTRDPITLKIAQYPQYFHPIVRPRTNSTIIEAGGYDGKTAIEIAKYLNKDCQIYSFEPEYSNFTVMNKAFAEDGFRGICYPINKGLWSTGGELSFDEGLGSSSKVTEREGTKKIQVVCLDDFIREKDISVELIKLDVEGVERSALEGAKNSISFFQPQLQVCVYHNPNDIWDLILYLNELNPYYKIYFGHHTRSLIETVIYAHC